MKGYQYHKQEWLAIERFAWDLTVGQGCTEEDDPQEPTARAIAGLEVRLGRGLNDRDLQVFSEFWRQCMQSAQQP